MSPLRPAVAIVTALLVTPSGWLQGRQWAAHPQVPHRPASILKGCARNTDRPPSLRRQARSGSSTTVPAPADAAAVVVSALEPTEPRSARRGSVRLQPAPLIPALTATDPRGAGRRAVLATPHRRRVDNLAVVAGLQRQWRPSSPLKPLTHRGDDRRGSPLVAAAAASSSSSPALLGWYAQRPPERSGRCRQIEGHRGDDRRLGTLTRPGCPACLRRRGSPLARSLSAMLAQIERCSPRPRDRGPDAPFRRGRLARFAHPANFPQFAGTPTPPGKR